MKIILVILIMTLSNGLFAQDMACGLISEHLSGGWVAYEYKRITGAEGSFELSDQGDTPDEAIQRFYLIDSLKSGQSYCILGEIIDGPRGAIFIINKINEEIIE